MASISLCMIVKNESSVLERCLNSIKNYVDEIIIVDTGSTDNTKEIAKKFTDKIYDFKWIDDFSAARNFSLSKATKDWILILDADEIITGNDMTEIIRLIEKNDCDAIELIQRNYTDDSTKSHWKSIIEKSKESRNYKGYGYNPIIRVIRNNLGIRYEGAVHEILNPSSRKLDLRLKKTEIPIHHYYEEKPLEKRQLEYLKLAEKAIKKNPNGRYFSIIASVNLHFKKDYAKAAEYFKKTIEYGYKENESYGGLAQSYIGLKQYDKAYDIYKSLIKKGYLTPALCNNVGNILFLHKKYPQALKFLNLSLKLGNPNRERIMKNIEVIKNKLKSKKRHLY